MARKPQDAWKAAAGGPPGMPALRKNKGGGFGKWIVAAVLLLALVGAILALFSFMKADPEPVVLALPIVQYAHADWPANPLALSDARALRERFGGEANAVFPDQEKSRLLGALNKVVDDSKGPAKGRPIVVYLSTLGVALNGVPYLLPGDAQPDDPGSWLKLDDILQILRKAEVPRLLILDIRHVNGTRAAFSTSDVNEELDALLTKIDTANDLPFTVINANNPTSGPNLLRPLNLSAFGLAVSHGIGGAADNWTNGGKDHRISVTELTAYVRETVQLPRSYGKGKDFQLRTYPENKPAAMPTPADDESPPDWLTASGKTRDAWLADGLHRRSPRVVRHLNRVSGRAEAHWLGGLPVSAIADRSIPTIQSLTTTAGQMPTLKYPTVSVAKMRLQADLAEKIKAANALLGQVIDRIRMGTKQEELMAAQALVWGKAAEVPYEAVAVASWDAALGLEDPTILQIQQIVATANGFRPRSKPAEMIALEMVSTFSKDVLPAWPKGTLRKYITLISAVEEAAMAEAMTLPWVEAKWNEANIRRRKVTVVLGDPESSDKQIAMAAQDLDNIRQEYAAIREIANALSTARREFEETRAGLAELAVYYPHEFTAIPDAVASTWAALVEDMVKMEQLLTPPKAAEAPQLAVLSRQSQSLRSNREKLKQMISVPESAGPAAIERALAWPWWTLTQRQDLFKRLNERSRETTDKALKMWPTNPANQNLATPEKRSDLVLKDTIRDVRRMLDLARLVDLKGYQELTTELGNEPNAATVIRVGEQVRTLLRRSIVAEFRSPQLARQVRMGWATEPDDADGHGSTANPEYADAVERHKAFLSWLATSHYQDDAEAWKKLKSANIAALNLGELARDIANFKP